MARERPRVTRILRIQRAGIRDPRRARRYRQPRGDPAPFRTDVCAAAGRAGPIAELSPPAARFGTAAGVVIGAGDRAARAPPRPRSPRDDLPDLQSVRLSPARDRPAASVGLAARP